MKNPTLEIEIAAGDESLMGELVEHHPEALEQLYQRYRAVLRAVVLRVVHDETETDDVLQDVFIQLWTRAEHYSPAKGRPLGWLITLARRRAIDRLRQRNAYRRATDRFEVEARHPMKGRDENHPVECAASRGDLRTLLEKQMGRLPPKQKDVVERAFMRGMSQREIANSMHLPLGTVKTRIELGLRKLSSIMVGARQKIV
ncbi:MAG: polymerase sigma-70 factor, subfamily [Chthoniobacter sp.]|jgi:RNA polymerase sigma-70 factor (ECF subfamily)|nr:polymerase sigma-70 factor, subfamily [Chthoniobacter sp.]